MGTTYAGHRRKAITVKEYEDGEERSGDVHIRYGGCKMQGWRANMEDTMCVYSEGFKEHGFIMFAIFDGHGGAETSRYCEKHLGPLIWKEIKDCGYHVQPSVLERAFLEFDWKLCREKGQQQKHMSCGSTASVLIVDSKKAKAFVCHLGDSRVAVFNPSGTVLHVTTDHNPIDEGEKNRIEKLSLKGDRWSRIELRDSRVFVGGCSSLNVTRCFGDHDFKRVKGIHQREQAVIAIPEIFEIDLLLEDDICFMLASDGIWGAKLTGPAYTDWRKLSPTLQMIKFSTAIALKSEVISHAIGDIFDDIVAKELPQWGKSSDNMSCYIVQIKTGEE